MITILTGDCRDILPTLPAESVQCCVTSPPYFALRDYGTATWQGGDAGCDHKPPTEWYEQNFNASSGLKGNKGTQSAAATNRWYKNGDCPKCGARRIDSQLGLESTPEEYIAKMVAVFREVWRVLRDDGTLWVNMGDSYASNPASGGEQSALMTGGEHKRTPQLNGYRRPCGLKQKDLCMMPARLAIALQAGGWYLRSEIVWSKPNPMPESVQDRPTKSHEMIYLLAKNGGNPLVWRARDTGEWSYKPDLSQLLIDDETPRWKGFDYFYDADAIKEKSETGDRNPTYDFSPSRALAMGRNPSGNEIGGVRFQRGGFRNKRSVWTVATQPYAEAHFATFPEDLIKPCILAGSRPGDTVLDPFGGSGTTAKVALELGRKTILIELNPAYVKLAEQHTNVTPGMF